MPSSLSTFLFFDLFQQLLDTQILAQNILRDQNWFHLQPTGNLFTSLQTSLLSLALCRLIRSSFLHLYHLLMVKTLLYRNRLYFYNNHRIFLMNAFLPNLLEAQSTIKIY